MNTALTKSPEWLATHRATIGGSNAAAAVGLHSYKTPVALYYEMVLGQAEDLETNPDALRGILLEPIARQRLADVLGMEIIEHDQDDFIRNTRYHWAHCLPDGFIACEGATIPIEIKIPNPENYRRLDVEIQDYIQCQCVHNAAVIGAPALMLACMNPVTMEIYRQLYEPKQDAIDALMEAEQTYYDQYIVPRIPPPAQTHEDLSLLFPRHVDGKRVIATDDIAKAHEQLVEIKVQNTHLDHLIADLNLDIKTHMEDGEILVDAKGRILATWKAHIQTTLDSQALQAAKPDVWAEFARERPVRTFLVKKPKGLRL